MLFNHQTMWSSFTFQQKNLFYANAMYVLESCVGQVWELALLCVRVWGGCELTCCRRELVVLGVGRVWDKKFFLQVTEHWAKAHELNQLKNRETLGCTEVVC